MNKLLIFLIFIGLADTTTGQINAKLVQYMDISHEKIVFVYGGDIWLVQKDGGTAYQLTHSPGEESWPKFSPDGKEIAFTAAYQGNSDIYVLPVTGGMPHRVTYQSWPDRMIEWHPDGKHLLFASRRELGQRSSNQFFTVSKEGGMPEKLPIPYGELASYSPDGNSLAYITKITENYPFKRYRGGLASDVYLYDAKTQKVSKITDNPANDGKPAWAGNKIYFLSDRGKEVRLNIWEHDLSSSTKKQITNFSDFDISFLSAGPKELVYEAGGELYTMDLNNQKSKKVNVNIISDLSQEMSRHVDVSRNINNVTASPGGSRVVFEARGELFNVPAKDGFTVNLTNSSGAFDRNPSWSPDGKNIAYWSDKDGENNIFLVDAAGSPAARKLTSHNKGFGYNLYWSPDSKLLTYMDETNTIYLLDTGSGTETKIHKNYWNRGHGGRFGFRINWSSDSKWLTYHAGQANSNEAIYVYDVENKKSHQVTSGFYNDNNPVFSSDGKYLFYKSDRNFSPVYSDMGDGTWVYPNSTQIAALALTPDAPHLLKVKNDEVKVKEEKKDDQDKRKDGEKEVKKEEANEAPSEEEKKDDKEEKKEDEGIKIDFENLEDRIMILPVPPGNIGELFAFEGKIVYRRFPNSGSNGGTATLMVYDLKEEEEKEVMDNVGGVDVTADGKSLIVNSTRRFGIIQPAPGQKIKDAIPTDGLTMDLVPREEWMQIFNDAWRRHRDFFYDPAMHGLNWTEVGNQYRELIKDARTRSDLNNIISNLVSELSAGHTYTSGGDLEQAPFTSTGFLGINWGIKDGHFMIKEIIKPAAWDTEVRSPLDRPGLKVKEGDVILAVNNLTLDPNKDPYAAFAGLAGKTVKLTISEDGTMENAKDIPVSLLSQGQEQTLRYLAWVEANRKMVDELSDGQLGYVYMSNTGGRGQLELVRMYYGQVDKKGFIIDERFNGGGQLADRFLELMTKPVVYNLHWRHGQDHTHPQRVNTGPMGMLINGWAGSGGDGLPWAFQELKAGPIVGERTLGILVGPATGHQLVDGGRITVPGARLYDNDGHWFWEGEGVSPDIEVWDDPNILMQGRDPQLERVVSEVMKLVKQNPPKMTPAPAPEIRTARAIGSN